MEFQGIDILAIFRMALLFLHVLAVIAAGVGIALGDYAILSLRGINTRLLFNAGQITSLALLFLWMTGLAIIWVDTRFEWSVLIATPKLLAKLTVVTLLSLNGVLLHQFVFKRLNETQSKTQYIAKVLTLSGTISIVSWIYAIFLGLAKPVAPLLGFSGFLGLYCLILSVGFCIAYFLFKPKLTKSLMRIQSNVLLPGLRTI